MTASVRIASSAFVTVISHVNSQICPISHGTDWKSGNLEISRPESAANAFARSDDEYPFTGVEGYEPSGSWARAKTRFETSLRSAPGTVR